MELKVPSEVLKALLELIEDKHKLDHSKPKSNCNQCELIARVTKLIWPDGRSWTVYLTAQALTSGTVKIKAHSHEEAVKQAKKEFFDIDWEVDEVEEKTIDCSHSEVSD